jgi:DNA-binding MarR family transcriptional regulator
MAEKSVVEELQSRNERQRKTIVELTQEARNAVAKIKEIQIWERFAGYMLDNCEGQTVTEENLQFWLSEMLRKEAEALKGVKA